MTSPPKIPQIFVESPVTQRKFVPEMNPPPNPSGPKSGRNKVAVTHGHSMANWVTRVAKEQAKPPSHRLISPEELHQHNKKEDAWIVLRGKVFDITDYIEYHPGGKSVLIKLLGKDGTKDFNAIHNYVNMDSILKNRQVGLYLPPAQPSSGPTKGSICCGICGGSNAKSEHIPATYFEQNDTSVIYEVECRCVSMDPNYWSVGVSDKQTLMIRAVTQPPEVWLANLTLSEKLNDDQLQLTFEHHFKKMVLTLQKPSPTKWKTLGSPTKSHNKIMDSSETPRDYYPATIVIKEELSTENYLFGIHTGPEVRFGIPIGWHVFLKIGEVEKAYTPVRWMTPEQVSAHEPIEKNLKGQVHHFLIKTHKDGRLTGPLNGIEINELGKLEMGAVQGSFDTSFLVEIDRLILIAGGTGIAPFVNIVLYIGERRKEIKVNQVILLHSARSTGDLLWRDTWDSLTKLGWFHYVPYVTRDKPPEGFTCKNGRVNATSVQEDLKKIPLPENSSSESMLVRGMGCGPVCFTDTCHEIFRSLSLKEYEYILFEG